MVCATVGRFEIQREIFSTPLLSLCKAKDPKGQRTVALYMIRMDSPEGLQLAARFRDQAKNACVLNSPNIPCIYGGAAEAALFLISMEYVEGTSLRAMLERGDKFAASELVDLARQVCSALEHAHHHGIFHADLHPGNVLLELDGTAKVMDFGVPKNIAFPAPEPPPDSYRYLSPEQVRGAPPDARSNLFSWGAILYEIATGRKAFAATTAEELRREILERVPPAPHEVNGAIPVGISQAIMKALSKDPAARHQRGSESVSHLESYRRSENPPIPTPPPPRVSPAMNRPAPAPSPAPVRTHSNGVPGIPVQDTAHAAVSAPREIPAKPPTIAQAKARTTAALRDVKTKLSAPETDKRLNKLLSRAVPVVALLAFILVAIGVVYYIQGRSTQQPEATPAEPALAVASNTSATPTPVDPAPTPEPEPAKAPATAAAPAPSAITTGEAAISSVPDGAQVLIDGAGESSWKTPLIARNLGVGEHSITFNKPGFASHSETIQIEAGKRTTFVASLAELGAAVAVSSEPAGAAVVIDGKDSGKITPARVVLTKGHHTLTIRKAGFFDYSTQADLTPGQSVQIRAPLRVMGNADEIKTAKGGFGKLFGGGPKDMGSLQIKTRPKGARITINNRTMDKNTPAEFFLRPGHYEVVLELRGYKTLRKILNVETTSKLVMDEALQR